MGELTHGRTRRLILLLCLVAAVLAGALTGVTVTGARAAGKPSFRILVLGDSYSAGNGAGSYVPPAGCWRSPHNYAQEFADLLAAAPYNQPSTVVNRACSGATTADFWTSFKKQPPEIDAVNKSFHDIFLTIGGNDVNFAGIGRYCMVEPTLVANHCLVNLDNAIADVTDGSLQAKLVKVLAGIRARANPNAKIVLLGYPGLIKNTDFTLIDRKEGSGSDAGKTCGTRSNGTNYVTVGACLVRLAALGDQLEQRTVSQLDSQDHTSQFAFVSVAQTFAGHQLVAPVGPTLKAQHSWFIQPYTSASRTDIDIWYHPNQTGWLAEAKLLINSPIVPKSLTSTAPAPSAPAAWTTVGTEFSVPSNFTNVQPTSVSCMTATTCMTVGSNFDSPSNRFTGLAELWNGSHFTMTTLAQSAGVDLWGVSCPTSSTCMTVGRTAFNGTYSKPVAEAWAGGHWFNSNLPIPGGYEWANLFAVSCVATQNCVAVGEAEAAGQSSPAPLSYHFNGVRWIPTAMPDPSGNAQINAISCVSATSCYAAGAYTPKQNQEPLIEHWNGTSWQNTHIAGSPNVLGATTSNELKGISCPTVGFCAAVGIYGAYTFNGQQWTLSKTPLGGSGMSFSSVVCPSANDCTAVGDGSVAALAGDKWVAQHHALAGHVTLNGVASASGNHLIVVGYRTTTNSIYAVAEHN